jgi:hypothetical protein
MMKKSPTLSIILPFGSYATKHSTPMELFYGTHLSAIKLNQNIPKYTNILIRFGIRLLRIDFIGRGNIEFNFIFYQISNQKEIDL